MNRSIARLSSSTTLHLGADDIYLSTGTTGTSHEDAITHLAVPPPFPDEASESTQAATLGVLLPDTPFCFKTALKQLERYTLHQALALCGNNVEETAAHLGYKRGWVYKKLQLYKISS